MPADAHRLSTAYAVIQALLLLAFAVVFFAAGGRTLFASVGAVRIAGNVLCVAGLLVGGAGFGALGRAVQIAPEPKRSATLVTHGIYRWLRHPMYTAIVLVVSGLFLRRPTVPVLVGGVVVVAFLLAKARFEERLLLARYPGYAEYRKTAGGVLIW